MFRHQDYDALRQRTIFAIKRLQLRYTNKIFFNEDSSDEFSIIEWPLYYHGAGEITEIEIDKSEKNPSPRTICKWLLTILGEYIYPPFPAFTTWSILTQALEVIGWEQEEIQMLFIGQPLGTILGVNSSSEYIIDMKPDYALEAGWIDVEQSKYFYSKLEELRNILNNFDVRLLPVNFDKEDPILLREYRQWLLDGYEDVISKLATSISANLGIITSTVVQL